MFDDFDTQVQVEEIEFGIEWAERFDLALDYEDHIV